MINGNASDIKSPRHKAALAYAEAGIPIFPCRPNRKEPVYKGSFYGATTDPAQINAWWAEDDYNVAFSPEAAGLGVIDVDPDGKTPWQQFCVDNAIGLDTRTVSTPRG